MEPKPVTHASIPTMTGDKPFDFSFRVPDKNGSYRVMVRQGDSYVGDVDGDGVNDVWQGRFNAVSPFGVGEFSFNGGVAGENPKKFKTANQGGQAHSLGDRVGVETEFGEIKKDLTIAGWSLVAAKGEFSVQPEHILVSVNFYTRPEDEGFGDSYNIGQILPGKRGVSSSTSYRDVSSEFELRSAKMMIDLEYDRLKALGANGRKWPAYRQGVHYAMGRYFDLIKRLYEFWPFVIRARERGDYRSYPGVQLEYDRWGYTSLIEGMWQNGLDLLKDYEEVKPADRMLRAELIGDLFRHIQFSDLAWQHPFYNDLANAALKESR